MKRFIQDHVMGIRALVGLVLGAISATSLMLPLNGALANDAVMFSYGPTIPYTVVRFDAAGKAHADVFTAGAGFSLNFNLKPSADGQFRYLTFGVPIFVSHSQGTDFAFSTGASIGTLNNLLSIGAVYDLVNVGADQLPDTGLFTGDFGKANLKLIFGLNFNLGSGAPEAASGARKATASNKRPPNYIW